jgi:tetratricopeptide (TPR) repeat protein
MWILLILVAATSLAIVVYYQRKKRQQRSLTARSSQSFSQSTSSTTHRSATRSTNQPSRSSQSAQRDAETGQSPAPALPQATSQTAPIPPQLGSNYTHLRNLLAAKQWEEADNETSRLLLKIAGREEEKWLDPQSIASLPCAALQTIDQLWMEYSEGLFGFTVQKDIWMQCGGEVDYETECLVGERVGWYVEGSGWTYISQDNQIFSLAAPSGYLPMLLTAKRQGILPRWMGCTEVTHSALAWRLSSCSSTTPAEKQKPVTVPPEINTTLVQQGETSVLEVPILTPSDSVQLNYQAASALLEQGRIEEALDAYNKLLSLYPQSAELHQGKAVALFYLQRVDEASQACDVALQINPTFVEAHHLKAGILYAQGRLQEALEFCNAVDRLNPQFSPNLPLRQQILDELRQV